MNNFSKIGFILATLGSSIGLGHIWRFPYMTGANGGGAFVIFYLILALCIGVSMLLAEMLLGNKARSNPLDNYIILDKLNSLPADSIHNAHQIIDKNANKSLMWLGINAVAGPIILSFYAVVMGWIVFYLIYVSFHLPNDMEQAKKLFEDISAHSIWWQTLCFGCIIALTALIVARGIKKGIESLNLILMPLLFLIFIGLLVYASSLPEFHKALDFMFQFEPTNITTKTIIESLGQVFFSLSLGVGTIAVYAASADKSENLFKSAVWVVLSGIVVSLIAGLMIFAFIYHFGGEPSDSVGLLFISLPLAFNALDSSGQIVSLLFFIAVLFAGITSTISMLEPGVSILRDKFSLSQAKASYLLSFGVFVLGFLVILWANADMALPKIFGKSLFGALDSITSSLLMPLGMLTLLLFVGWRVKRTHLQAWTPYLPKWLFRIWLWIIRIIAPMVIVIILLSQYINLA
ncbi:sodium-dependent transporter [Helicobacter jaachi]|uniref:Transporter n=1 Tax=Helicobacter jaachi TaxID=1677920 RepID=A0A4U8TCI9_9HELI|nr:sodium-dependent transporter [Helicobacter jaachi]TLD97384.1 sodium-dependent transporter [Helicobacter jaachi]